MQPQYSYSEPRRTQRLEPPAREETPDPFEQSPDDVDHDPFLPESSPDVQQGYLVEESQGGLIPSMPSVHLEQHSEHLEEDENEESQLFPGSDLF